MSAAAEDRASGERTPLGNVAEFAGGVQEVAAGIFAWIQPNGGLGESNAGLVVGDSESLLVDTLWDETLTHRMLEALAPARAGAPIRTLLNTHGDGDHWYGNGLLGGCEIIATDAAAAQMRAEPPSMLTRMAPLGRLAGLGSAVPLLPARGRMRGLAGFGEMLSRYDFAAAEPRLPTRTFSGTETIEAADRRIELIEVGPAHTGGDAIVWLAEERVLFSGDIIFNGVTPIMWRGPASNWIAALQRIADLDPVAIVPGHGPLCDLDRVRELVDYWTYLLRSVPAGGSGAITELASELVEGVEFRTSPWGAWTSPERTYVNVAIIARRRDGNTEPISSAQRIALIAGMGAFRERLVEAGVVS